MEQCEDPARLFYRLWTLKESYVKLTGTGISVPLSQITFLFWQTAGWNPIKIGFNLRVSRLEMDIGWPLGKNEVSCMIAAFGLVRPGREGEAFCSSNEINK